MILKLLEFHSFDSTYPGPVLDSYPMHLGCLQVIHQTAWKMEACQMRSTPLHVLYIRGQMQVNGCSFSSSKKSVKGEFTEVLQILDVIGDCLYQHSMFSILVPVLDCFGGREHPFHGGGFGLNLGCSRQAFNAMNLAGTKSNKLSISTGQHRL
eukprot:3755973-Amphidinium_carterae.2